MTIAKPPKNTPIPHCLYSCATDSCAEERSWPATDLYWVPAWGGWYCKLCINYALAEVVAGCSLAEFLAQRKGKKHDHYQ